VAKKADLIGVKVLGDDGSGSTSGVIQGLQWAAENAQNDGMINKSGISLVSFYVTFSDCF
jgi:subtilisin family serine protease